MTDQIAYQEYIQRRYNAFCKTVIRCAALDKILKLKRQWERQVSLDYKLYGPNGGDTNSVTASAISGGYPEIVFAIGGLAVGFVAAMLIFKKKSKPVLVEGTANEDEE